MQALIEAALLFVNGIRVKHGVEPLTEMPKGGTSGYICPIANALRDIPDKTAPSYASRDGVNVSTPHMGTYPYIEYPSEVRRFVEAFDSGLIPELRA